jgi:hypothetical protein
VNFSTAVEKISENRCFEFHVILSTHSKVIYKSSCFRTYESPNTPYRTTFRAEIFMRGSLVFQLFIYQSIEEHSLYRYRVTFIKDIGTTFSRKMQKTKKMTVTKNVFCIFHHEESIKN